MSDETPEERIRLLEDRVDTHEERITTHGREIDELKEAMVEKRVNDRHRDESMRRIEEKVDRTDTKLDVLRQDVLAKPARKWEDAKWLIVAAVVTAVVGYMLGRVGLG